jgi:hypothetical protein
MSRESGQVSTISASFSFDGLVSLVLIGRLSAESEVGLIIGLTTNLKTNAITSLITGPTISLVISPTSSLTFELGYVKVYN